MVRRVLFTDDTVDRLRQLAMAGYEEKCSLGREHAWM
jgi:hypothetical protein